MIFSTLIKLFVKKSSDLQQFVIGPRIHAKPNKSVCLFV